MEFTREQHVSYIRRLTVPIRAAAQNKRISAQQTANAPEFSTLFVDEACALESEADQLDAIAAMLEADGNPRSVTCPERGYELDSIDLLPDVEGGE